MTSMQKQSATDMFSGRDIAGDANRVLDCVSGGGVAIFPASVGYAIVGHSEAAVRRIYAAKQRSYSKPCGWFGNWKLFNQIIDVPDRSRAVVDCVIHKHGLPLSIVGPFRRNEAFVEAVPDFVLTSASLKGTLDMLLNAGELHNAIASEADRRGVPVVGSSANLSLTGSKFYLQDVEKEVLDIADLTIDYGEATYRNDKGLGSTIIDLVSFKTFRVGAVYDRICAVLKEEFSIDLNEIGTDSISG